MEIIPEKLAVARTFAKELRGITLDDCIDFPFLVHGNAWHAGTIIERLCSEIEQLQSERDAAVKRLARYKKCIDCACYTNVVEVNMLCDGCEFGSKWQWRGPQEDKTKAGE